MARLKKDLKIFSDFPQNHVFWQKNGEIKFCPVDAEFLKDVLHGKKSILVSATLSVANSFNIIKEKLHIPEKAIVIGLLPRLTTKKTPCCMCLRTALNQIRKNI